MNPNITISDKAVSREVVVGNITKTEDRDSFSTYEGISNIAYFDTGLLPVDGTGMLSIRQAGNRMQFVFQHAPGIYYMIWGKGEGDKKAAEIHVAQPYRIVIGDHVNGELRGARHFYSPIPITSLTQQLYHCNVPNLNCKGYNGTSVGWICIYHKESYKDLPMGASIFKTIERASGHEAYNDANMSQTDGARFYQGHYGLKPELSYLWDPKAWQTKTTKEGFDWVLNPDLWLPIKVQGIDQQNKHFVDGMPFTLEMAMLGNYQAYYPHSAKDELELSLMNQIRRADQKNPSSKNIYDLMTGVFSKAKKKEAEKQLIKQAPIPGVSGSLLTTEVLENENKPWTSQAPVFQTNGHIALEEELEEYDPYLGDCIHCYKTLEEADEYYFDNQDHLICSTCFTLHYGKTSCCQQVILLGEQFYVEDLDVFYCYSCHSQSICENCGSGFLDAQHMVFGGYCESCADPCYCENCGGKFSEQDVQKVMAAEFIAPGTLANKQFILCIGCFQDSVICACGLLKPEDTCSTLPGTNKSVCQSCVSFNTDNEPVFVSVH